MLVARFSVLLTAAILFLASCGPNMKDMQRAAPIVLAKYGFTRIQLGGAAYSPQCPRGYWGITGTAEHTGTMFQVAVCWSGPEHDQSIAVIRRPLR